MTKVYIGNLDDRMVKRDVEELFEKYGPVDSVWVARQPPGRISFAFVTFIDRRDAEDACRDLNGKEIHRKALKVEIADKNKMGRGGANRGRAGGGRMMGRRPDLSGMTSIKVDNISSRTEDKDLDDIFKEFVT